MADLIGVHGGLKEPVNRTVPADKVAAFKADAEKLPRHLDPLSLILGKIEDLGPEERQWLETASLAEGRFRCDLIETAGGFPPGRSGLIVERLDNAGFIMPLLGGGYRFVHDRIQESVRGRLSQERKFSLYEKFGSTYETMACGEREFLFHAAEAYLKSRNVEKAIGLSYQAAAMRRTRRRSTSHRVTSPERTFWRPRA